MPLPRLSADSACCSWSGASATPFMPGCKLPFTPTRCMLFASRLLNRAAFSAADSANRTISDCTAPGGVLLLSAAIARSAASRDAMRTSALAPRNWSVGQGDRGSKTGGLLSEHGAG